jgi:hypothetical protein
MHASGFKYCTDIKVWIVSFASADRSTHLFLVALWWIWGQRNMVVLGDGWLMRRIYIYTGW